MTTSGSFDFTVSRDNIIQEALELLGVLSAEEQPTANDLASCSRTLNLIVKSWQGRGINIFTLQRAALFLEPSVGEYIIGGDARFGYSYGFTALDGALTASAVAVTVDSTEGMAALDSIGILMSDNTMHWDIIVSVDSSTTLTLTTGMAAPASDDAVVYFYTTTSAMPLRVHYMLHRNADGTEIPGSVWKQLQYIEIPNKNSTGQPLQGWFDRRIEGGVWKVWPRTTRSDEVHILYVHRQAEDFDAADDTPDYPQEWHWALATNLARNLITKYGVPSDIAREIRNMADIALFDAESFDVEDGFQIQPDLRR